MANQIGLTDAISAFDALITYFTSMSEYYLGSLAVPPSFSDIASQFTNDNLYNEIVTTGASQISTAVGAKIQVANMISAVTREALLRSYLKAQYFSLAASQASDDSSFYTNQSFTETSLF